MNSSDRHRRFRWVVFLATTILGVAGVVAAAASAGSGAGEQSAANAGSVASASSEGVSNQTGSAAVKALVDQLEQRGLTVVESASVLGSPDEGIPAGIAITVVNMVDDAYAPTSVYSRVIHEASYAKAVGRIDAGRVDVTVVSPQGAILVGGGPGPTIDPLPLPLPVSNVTELQAAERVHEYLASGGSGRFGQMLLGLTTTGVTVTDDAGERTLTLDLGSDGSQEATRSLTLLTRAAAVWGGWVSDLNEGSEGLGLAWVRIHVSYPDATPDLFSVIDPARQAIDWRGGGAADIGHQPVQAVD